MERTIVAISTANGNGGIGIIRLSGKNSFEIIEKIFKPKNNSKKIEGYNMKYGKIVNPKNDEIIDEVLVSYFKAPKSYTTENMCEINSHGGMVVERRILELCLENGAEMAEPGEFTKRAFLNGRIDLSQAEGIIDLINSKTEREARESAYQLSGNLALGITKIEEKMMDIMVKIEVTIDYPEYDEEEVTNIEIIKGLEEIKKELEYLASTFERGKLLREGIKTVILGKPNAGKSSLLNTLLNEERAIVSDIEGTTRDTIEEFVNINGIPLNLIDTAGIRNTTNEVEQIGVKKSKKIAQDADLIIAIFDSSKELTVEDEEILNIIKNKKSIILLNKADLKSVLTENDAKFKEITENVIKISALNGVGLEKLYNLISKMFSLEEINVDNDVIVTNLRHKNLISKAIENVKKAKNTVQENMPIDIIAIFIKDILEDLGNITGEVVTDDIINEIFSKFCLGK